MSKVIINGGAGGTGSDECTARLSDVPAGLKAVTADSNDEAGVGTMTMTGNAQAGHVLAEETFYTNDCKTKQTGAMTVGSLLSFSVAAYSGKRVLAKWQNPNQAAGKPYSGVMIRYSTSEYPGAAGGTQIYKGAGNNTAAGGWSQAFLDMPALNRTYYFSCVPYVTCSAGEMVGALINFTCATGADLWLTFTAGQNYTVPEGYTLMDAFAVGGGGGAGYGNRAGGEYYCTGGGGGGYTNTARNKEVSSGDVLSIVVGPGGLGTHQSYSTNGKPSSVIRNGVNLVISGNEVLSVHNTTSPSPSSGGSGGGYGSDKYDDQKYGGGGGSDGHGGHLNGTWINAGADAGNGQGRTTRAYGDSNGTLYSGGGGGGTQTGSNSNVPPGGAGGGGNGCYDGSASGTKASNGAPNTGGGGGGSGYFNSCNTYGGSGIVLLHLY